MGYYTRFDLTIRDIDKKKKINTDLKHEILGRLYQIYNFTHIEKRGKQEIKIYPELNKTIKYFTDTMDEPFAKAQIIYEEFDEKKLKKC